MTTFSKVSSKGQQIEVEKIGVDHYVVRIDGAATTDTLRPVPGTKYYSIGRAGFTADEVAQIKALDAPAPVSADTIERDRLVAKLEGIQDRIGEGREQDEPGRLYAAEAVARQALADFDAAHPEEVARVLAEAAARQAIRDEDFASSNIARGLD